MKKYNAFLPIAILLFAACDNSNVTPEASPGPYLAIPYAVQDSIFGTHTTMIPALKLYNVSGYFMAGIRSGDITDTTGNLNSYSQPMHVAQFMDSSGNLVAPDSVFLNDRMLWPLTYPGSQQIVVFSGGFPDLWNNTGSNEWRTAGNSLVPAINTSITLPFPQFNTNLPDSFDIHQPFSFTFNSSNLQQADSAFLLVYSYTGNLWTSPVVHAGGGTATVDCSSSVVTGNSPFNTFFNLKGKIYYGGILALVAYRTEIHSTGGKDYAYVVETQKIKKLYFTSCRDRLHKEAPASVRMQAPVLKTGSLGVVPGTATTMFPELPRSSSSP